MARTKREHAPIFAPYTCPGCDKRGSVGFTLESLPYDFTCSACGMPTHLYRKDGTVILTFDHPDWAPVAEEEGE
jgi:transcription elongation factor Elf1